MLSAMLPRHWKISPSTVCKNLKTKSSWLNKSIFSATCPLRDTWHLSLFWLFCLTWTRPWVWSAHAFHFCAVAWWFQVPRAKRKISWVVADFKAFKIATNKSGFNSGCRGDKSISCSSGLHSICSQRSWSSFLNGHGRPFQPCQSRGGNLSISWGQTWANMGKQATNTYKHQTKQPTSKYPKSAMHFLVSWRCPWFQWKLPTAGPSAMQIPNPPMAPQPTKLGWARGRWEAPEEPSRWRPPKWASAAGSKDQWHGWAGWDHLSYDSNGQQIGFK